MNGIIYIKQNIKGRGDIYKLEPVEY